jgi:hypothetical protein
MPAVLSSRTLPGQRGPASRAVVRRLLCPGRLKAWIRSLYHHEKQFDKVVRIHNSHGRNAMRRPKFNFIKISCVIYKAHSTAFGKCYPELNHATFSGMVHKESSRVTPCGLPPWGGLPPRF